MDSVISNPDVDSIFQVPEALYDEGILTPILDHLRLRPKRADLTSWRRVASKFVDFEDSITVGMVGKYVTLMDSYVSVNQALHHAAAANNIGVQIRWIESEDFETDAARLRVLDSVNGIVLPQGYGKRGTEGKIAAANFARESGTPLLGLCFGFQLSIVSYARNVLNLRDANSTEIDPGTSAPVIDLLPEQREVSEKGGTMRLGGHDISVLKPSRAYEVYGSKTIRGRHRHRFELNQSYMDRFEAAGMRFSAFSDGGRRAEILELPEHPFYMGTQYHPEYLSRPEAPEPIFMAFMRAARKDSETRAKVKLTA